MVHRSEVVEEKQSILIVSKHEPEFVALLKEALKKYHIEVYISPTLPVNTQPFTICFLIDEDKLPELAHTKIAAIFIRKKIPVKKPAGTKIIHIIGNPATIHIIDKVLWFTLSQSKESLFTITSPVFTAPKKNYEYKHIFRFPTFTKKQIFFYSLCIILGFHLLFFIPLGIASLLTYQSATQLRQNEMEKSYGTYQATRPFLNLAKTLYSPVRPTYLFFSIALFPDNFFDINDKANTLLRLSFDLREEGRQIESLIQKTDKTQEEEQILLGELQHLNATLDTMHDTMISLSAKLPNSPKPLNDLKNQLSTTSTVIEEVEKIIKNVPSLFGQKQDRTYLLLFANNMELRPGGGFIGSFAILTVGNLSIKNFQVYDVYDADGQLTVHVDPPDPIRNYLHQPNYFLRDSAFSPDFLDNYAKAKQFLSQELKIDHFDGAFLFTTTSIQHILSSFGDIYLPDYDETINDRNFYLKAQIHSETDFFPGSTQKKGFLSSVARQIMINFDRVSLPVLAREIKRSFDEKQIVAYLDDASIQHDLFDTNYWSGRMIEPKCTTPDGDASCITDYLFPVDANLGVNKANFFVERDMNVSTHINVDGIIQHTFSMNIRNDSVGEVFPGGTYKNYFQLFLPKDSTIKYVTKNDVKIEGYDENSNIYKMVGFYFEVPPKKMVNIQVTYTLPDQLQKGKTLYQFIIQKQIGSTNNNLGLQFDLNNSIFLLNQNFSPLVKDKSILYNTNLTADKIFLLELSRD